MMMMRGGAIKRKLDTAAGEGDNNGYLKSLKRKLLKRELSQKAARDAEIRDFLTKSPRADDVENQDNTALDTHMINVKRSVAEMERWPGVVNGYIHLIVYTGFFLLYVFVILLQLDVEAAYDIDRTVRQNLLDQDGALANIATQGDVFDYLLKSYDSDLGEWQDGTDPDGGVLGKLFQRAWYNGDPYTADEQGYLFSYNRLIGGVLIVQERGGAGPCKGISMYDKFYPVCYGNKRVTAYPKITKYGNGTEIVHSGDAEYQAALNESKYGDQEGMSVPTLADTVKPSFQFDHTVDGFKVFLSLAEGADLNLKKVQNLAKFRWLDKATRLLYIKFTFYNGNFRRFAFASVRLTFDQGGQFLQYDGESSGVSRIISGGTSVVIASVKMEPYITGDDFLRLGLEIVFMLWTFIYITQFVRQFVLAVVQMKLKEHLNAWMLLDATNYLCFVIYFILRIQLIKHILDNTVAVPTNKYEVVFEDAAAKTRQQLTVNFVNILLCIFRFFKFYQFQPRLRIVNKTLGASMLHMYHFCVIFFVIFVGFSVIAHIIFGSMYRDFYTLQNSFQALWESLFGNIDLGPTICNSNLSYLNPYMGVIFFVAWIFIAFMVLLNVFLAILMDGYASAKEDGEKSAKRLGHEMPEAVADDVIKFLKRTFIMFDKRSWVYNENDLRIALKRLDEKMADPAKITANKYEQELEVLQQQQEVINARIEELETLAEDPLTHPFHPDWADKAVSLRDIARVMPTVSAKFETHKPNVGDMAQVWNDLLSYVPEHHGEGHLGGVNPDILTLKGKLEELIQENRTIRAQLADP